MTELSRDFELGQAGRPQGPKHFSSNVYTSFDGQTLLAGPEQHVVDEAVGSTSQYNPRYVQFFDNEEGQSLPVVFKEHLLVFGAEKDFTEHVTRRSWNTTLRIAKLLGYVSNYGKLNDYVVDTGRSNGVWSDGLGFVAPAFRIMANDEDFHSMHGFGVESKRLIIAFAEGVLPVEGHTEEGLTIDKEAL